MRNPVPKTPNLLNRMLIGRRENDDKNNASSKLGLVLIGNSGVVIALHHDGVLRHHDDWRVCTLNDSASNLGGAEKCIDMNDNACS